MLQIKKRVMCIISAVSLCASAFPYTALANDYFVINTIAGEGGSVSPKYSTEVPYGESLTVTMTPDFNYEVSDVIIDGKSVGDVDSYTFQFITSDHTLKAEFEKTKKYTSSNSSGSSTTQQTPTVTTPTVDSNKIFHIITSTTGRGKIDPAGNASVNGGGSVTFNIVPETGYEISEVYIDDVYVGMWPKTIHCPQGLLSPPAMVAPARHPVHQAVLHPKACQFLSLASMLTMWKIHTPT